MKPKRPRDLIKPTANQLNMSQQLVEDVISYYWATLQKALSNIESASVRVTGLGTFKVRYKNIDSVKRKYENYLNELDKLDKMTFNKHSLKKLSEFKLNRLEQIQKEIKSEYKRKDEIKKKRKDYVNSKNLEK